MVESARQAFRIERVTAGTAEECFRWIGLAGGKTYGSETVRIISADKRGACRPCIQRNPGQRSQEQQHAGRADAEQQRSRRIK